MFVNPVAKSLAWSRIENLMVGIGCVVIEGKGSHVGFVLGEDRWPTVRPHPRKEAKPYQILEAREFLSRNGVTS